MKSGKCWTLDSVITCKNKISKMLSRNIVSDEDKHDWTHCLWEPNWILDIGANCATAVIIGLRSRFYFDKTTFINKHNLSISGLLLSANTNLLLIIASPLLSKPSYTVLPAYGFERHCTIRISEINIVGRHTIFAPYL